MAMRATRVCLSVILLVGLSAVGHPVAAESSSVRGRVWIQPAFGAATGDDVVTSDVPADVGVSGIPVIGSIGVTVPLIAEVELEDPAGIMLGGEIVFGRIGIEASAAYVRRAAVARGGIKVRGGLLTEEQWDLLDLFGLTLQDAVFTEQEIENVAVSLGVNYHVIEHGRWDVWAGPMVVWSAWSEYDLSDARVELTQSIEDLLEGEISEFELSSNPSIAPEDALTYGASAGASFTFAGDWFLVGNVRYFVGDKVELPGGSGEYSVLSFSVGVGVGIGG
jgi:hypothetical protein